MPGTEMQVGKPGTKAGHKGVITEWEQSIL